ncbi:MAG: lipoate--protein ligase, partial [Chloroflexia bacterium]|nr:lipoate--protein ligase [Chloroflexia bacterium]
MEKLLCINNYCTDPYFNLATEEYLLKNRQENVFMLWQNEPTVVVGKHQNIHAEINHDFISEKNIKVARRLSGGGTVYHDLGNLNFTYIMTGEQGKMVDFTKYTNDILEVLNNLGANAVRNKRNDLIINNKKISGNAEHIFKQRVIHHGTLLFDSDLEILDETIKVKEGKYTDKAVQSVRSKVTNILPHLNAKIGFEEFRKALIDHILVKYKNASLYEISEKETEAIQKLKKEKYTTWEWIYGYSPKYVLSRKIEKPEGTLNIELSIKKV